MGYSRGDRGSAPGDGAQHGQCFHLPAGLCQSLDQSLSCWDGESGSDCARSALNDLSGDDIPTPPVRVEVTTRVPEMVVVMVETVDVAGCVTISVTVTVSGMKEVKTAEAISSGIKLERAKPTGGSASSHGDQLGGCHDVCGSLGDCLGGLNDSCRYHRYRRRGDGEDCGTPGLRDGRQDGGRGWLEHRRGDGPPWQRGSDDAGLDDGGPT